MAGRKQFDGKNENDVIQKLESAFALDSTVEEACFYADISTSAYFVWIKEHPELLDRFQALRSAPVLAARKSVVEALKSNPDLSLKYLERKRRAEFATRSEQEQKQVTEFDDMDKNDLAEIMNLGNKAITSGISSSKTKK